MRKSIILTILLSLVGSSYLDAKTIEVCKTCAVSSIAEGIALASKNDVVLVKEGVYAEHDIDISKPITLRGEGNSVIDAENKGYGLLLFSDSITIEKMTVTNIGNSYTKDFAAIYVSKIKYFTIQNCTLTNVFFGMLIEKSHYGVIRHNDISSDAIEESSSGNGIHLWSCSNLQVDHNELQKLRDGIYLEFVSESKIEYNLSHHNIRYGLHFMFSNDDEYHYNQFYSNGAGVAVMFSKRLAMTHNRFSENWGSASYGLLLKEIYDAEIEYNTLERNTIGINAEGATRVNYKHNYFLNNGWALKVSGACYANDFSENNFINNSFDVSYDSKVNDNKFDHNYWSTYTGYDLDKNGVGDIPFRPVKLFSYIVNRTPETILLLRSLFMELLNFSEKVSPVFTPDNLLDNHPSIKKFE